MINITYHSTYNGLNNYNNIIELSFRIFAFIIITLSDNNHSPGVIKKDNYV